MWGSVMRIHIAGAIAAAILASSSAVNAADLATEMVEVPAWDGFYVGAHVGYGWGDADFAVNTNKKDFIHAFDDAKVYKNGEYKKALDGTGGGVAAGALLGLWLDDQLVLGDGGSFGFSGEDDLEGFLGGLQVGFNVQSGRFVFGVEGDISFAEFDADTSFSLATAEDLSKVWFGSGIDGSVSAEINWLSTLRGRVGVAFDNVLIFATGGLALADVDIGGTLSATAVALKVPLTTSVSYSDSDIQAGYVVGGGVEWLFARNWSVKGEYQFIDLGEETIGFNEGTTADVDLSLHVVKVGINYHF